MEFLGYGIGAHGLSPSHDIVRKITDAPRPETVKQHRSILGLVGYYRRFIPQKFHIQKFQEYLYGKRFFLETVLAVLE